MPRIDTFQHQGVLLQAPYVFFDITFFFLIGGYACVSENTLLETPTGKVKIKDFRGGSLFAYDEQAKKEVVTEALCPVNMGTDGLYEVLLTNGKKIKATKKHKFLTPDGYKTIESFSSLQPLLTYERNLLESISDTCQTAQHEDALSLKKKAQGYSARCCSCLHPNGEPLPLEEASDLKLSPLQDDAQTRNLCLLQKDDQQHEHTHTHACLCDDRPCNCRSRNLLAHREKTLCECSSLQTSSEHTSDSRAAQELFPLNKGLCHTAAESLLLSEQSLLSSSFSFNISYVESITYIGDFDYYDLHVPTYNNYLAEGFVNHNCGKTSGGSYAVIRAVQYFAGKKDSEGKSPKIGLCGITLTFLKKTFAGALQQLIAISKTPFRFDGAHNVLYVCDIEIHLTAIENPEDIYGYDWCIGHTQPICTKRGDIPIKDVVVGDEVFTRAGWKKVIRSVYKGVKETEEIISESGHTVRATKEHKILSTAGVWKEQQDLTFGDSLVILDQRGNTWQEKQKELLYQIDLNSTESRITGIQKQQNMSEGCTSLLDSRTEVRSTTLCCGKNTSEKCQKDEAYTTKTVTTSITNLITFAASHAVTTLRSTILSGQKKEKRNNESICERHSKNVLSKCTKKEIKAKSLRKCGKNEKEKMQNMCTNVCAFLAEGTSMQGSHTPMFARTNVHLHTGDIKESVFIKRSKRKLEPVYDLEIEGQHEFFAGGILVHNCCAIIDELDELPTVKSIEVVKAVTERCRQQLVDARSPFLIFTTTSQGLKGTYKTINQFKKNRTNYLIVRGETRQNTSLPLSYVRNLYAMCNEKERACLLEGKFVAVDAGNVYPDYIDTVNGNHRWRDIYSEVSPDEIVYIGQDFNGGFNKAVAIVVRRGIIYVVKEYNFPDARKAPQVFRYDFPKNKICWIPDATAVGTIVQYRKELRMYNIEVKYRKMNPFVKDRVFLINKLFHLNRLYVCDFCKELDIALTERQNDKQTGLPMKGKTESAPDHINDCLEYCVYYVVLWLRELKDVYDVVLSRRVTKKRDAGLLEDGDDRYTVERDSTLAEQMD